MEETIKKEIIENLVDTEQVIADKLKDPNFDKIILTKNYGYVALRLTGTGLAEREGETWDRDLEVFSCDTLMNRYANINICFSHPKNENGEFVELGFSNSDLIIGNTIDSFMRDGEIWVIGRIFNLKALDFLAQYDLSTSPHFLSKKIENDDGTIIEQPLIINHLAIVGSGFWDDYTDLPPIQNGGVHIVKEEEMAEEEQKKEEKEEIADSILETSTTAEQKVDSDDNQEIEVPTTTIPSKAEEEVKKMEEEVAKLKENEIKESESFEELAKDHKELNDEEKKVEKEEVKKEEEIEKKTDETPIEEKEVVKEEEVIEPKESGVVSETIKDIVVDKLIQEANWTDDDDKRDEIIKEVAHLVDEAKTKGMELVRPHFGVERLTPSATLKKFLVANSQSVDSKYQGILAHIDEAKNLEIGMDIFNSLKAKVKNAKVQGVGDSSYISYPDGTIQVKI